MLLTEARRTARIAVAANWSPLDDQDRFSWNVVGRRSRC
jgi:predicted RNA polymerase sigma factor